MTVPAQIRDVPGGCLLNVRVVPRARLTALAGWRNGALVLRVAAPPVEGAANTAATGHLAELLGIPRRRIRIVAGAASHHKQIQIDGISAADLRARLTA